MLGLCKRSEPSDLCTQVTSDIRPVLSSTTVVLSVAIGLPTLKLRSLLGTQSVLHLSADVPSLRHEIGTDGIPERALLEVAASCMLRQANGSGEALVQVLHNWDAIRF